MMNSLRDVLHESVRDLYSAETQLLKALPRMAKAASDEGLKEAFQSHLEETQTQVQRLEEVCQKLGVKPKGKVCQAMKGLVEEGAEVISEKGSPAAKDAALIVAAQKVEHYEIAGYGAACAFAKVLGETEVAELLGETLEEEKAADEKLNGIAENTVNDEADEEENEEDEDDEEDEEEEEDEDEEEAKPTRGKATSARK
jgi:ferritin-like metal-binding protein YciE